MATSPRFNFIGNVQVGKEILLAAIKENYDAVLFAFGASKDRRLDIPGEDLSGVHSARAFVGWYNGLPEYEDLAPDLSSGDTAVVIGNGNVALDVARILLSGVDRLRTTDISENALETLSKSNVKTVHVVGRRGPLQASFTIKELRELITLPNVQFHFKHSNFLPDPTSKLPRAQKRISDLLRKHANSDGTASRAFYLDFMKSPVSFSPAAEDQGKLGAVHLASTAFAENQDVFSHAATVRPDPETPGSSIPVSLAFRSIGYKSEPLTGMDRLGFVFDNRAGIIPNDCGRVLSPQGTPVPGMYCTGWVKSGPTGVIATTMEDAFAAAETIVEDCKGEGQGKKGWEALKETVGHRTVAWQDWLKIDKAEKARGRLVGKEREKFRSVEEMLSVLD